MWTEQQIKDLLTPETNKDYARAVTRAIVAIYNNQTLDEKSCEHTIQKNGIGFSAGDSHLGSYMAKFAIKSKKSISGKFLVKAQKMAIKYRKQLLTIANEKA
jgi:hypothetical protein